MTSKQAKQKIEESGGNWKVFQDWICGQTCPFVDGKPGYYEYDVDRFIRYKCNPKNELSVDFD